jgi:probable rRNA maturation factor
MIYSLTKNFRNISIICISDKHPTPIRFLNHVKGKVVDLAHKEGFELEELTIVFCDDDYLLDLNKKHLDHDFYTDILTFPYNDKHSKKISGDIVISIDRATENSREFNVSPAEEICRLIIHGILHLSGYNDLCTEDKLVMSQKENFYLPVFLNVPRGTFTKKYA